VDLEGDLICALSEIKRLRKMKWLQKENMKEYIKEMFCTKEISKETGKIIIILKTQVEEANILKKF
jgi:hypothetical protein